jgi:protein involved in polysaccharide export with SLBB domain
MKSLLTLLIAMAAMLFGQSANAQATVLAVNHNVIIELKAPAVDAQTVSGPYQISAQGTIRLPHLNAEIRAAGLTHTELGRRIEAAYKAAEIYTNPAVNVRARDTEGKIDSVVNVGGAVRSGGREVPLREGMRLFAAITAAGGFDEFADVKNVRIIRGTRSMTFNLRKIENDGSNNPVLEANDQIIVPQD